MILIVDDDRSLCMSLTRLLRSVGHEASWVTNGRDALDLLHLHAPALIILDIRMTPMSGLTVLGFIKRDTRLQRIPVILYTADPNDESRREALQLGATDFIPKTAAGCDVLLKRIATLVGSDRDVKAD